MEGAVEGMSPDILVKYLSSQDDRTLVIDCRPFMAYNTAHVVHSVNVHCPPILKRRSGGFVALENIVPDARQRDRLRRGEYEVVVVYDQTTHDLHTADTDSSLYSVVKSLHQQVDLARVFFIVGGYDAVSEDCPVLCVTPQFSPFDTGRCEPQSQVTGNDQPVEILPHVLLGNVHHSSRLEELQRLGVTALVNVSTSCDNLFPTHFRYLHIPVNDSASEDLSRWFPVANQFIDEVQHEGGRVLVHCHAGRSRSATICLAYLINTHHYTLESAFEHVRSRREVIDPNLNFMRQLQDYQKRVDTERLSVNASAAASTPVVTPPSPSLPSSSASESGVFGFSGHDLPPPSPSLPSSSVSEPGVFGFSGIEFPPPTPTLQLSSSHDADVFGFSSPDLPASTPILLGAYTGIDIPPPSPSLLSVSGAGVFSFNTTALSPHTPSPLSGSASSVCAIPSSPQTPREAAAPISLPSSSQSNCIPPAYSSPNMPPPSPATVNDVHCFFTFTNTQFPFPSRSLARTPEIPLPSWRL